MLKSKLFCNLYPIEKLVLIFSVLTVLLFWICGIALRDPLTLYLDRLSAGFTTYFAGLVVSLLITRLSGFHKRRKSGKEITWAASWFDFSKAYLTIPLIMRDVRLFNAVSLMFVVFINLKHLVPSISSWLYGDKWLFDKYLLDIEKWAFSGQLLSVHLLAFIGSIYGTLLSSAYTLFYPYVAILVFIFIMQRDEALAQRFFSAFALTWFLGVLTVYFFPTLGPCFYLPSTFNTLPATNVTEMQEKLWQLRNILVEHPTDASAIYSISGLPSLHVAIVFLGSLYLHKFSHALAACSWLFLGITLVTTVYFGWHYLLDNIAALLLVGIAVFVSDKLFSTNQPRNVGFTDEKS